MLNVIDISGWQKGMNLATMFAKNPDLGGVVIKATGGVSIYQSTFKPWADWCIANGKPFGFYHFLDDDFKHSSGAKEAQYFVNKTRDYFGKGIPVADYEAQAKDRMGAKYLKEFLDEVYALTGVKAMVYMSLGSCAQSGMKAIAEAGYPLWVAQYPDYNKVYGFNQNPWKRGAVTPWKQETMRQYTSQMYLPGWKSHVDADIFYGDRADWNKIVGFEPVYPPNQKTVDDIAKEVIDGKWGNGAKRIAALTEAGWDYDTVQKRVNELLSAPKKTEEDITKVARDVIAGKYGNGVTRRIKLAAKGYDYDRVQAAVNKILLG